jgi:scyllo-inositol 2-dehydrogenase (NADP+)
MSSPTQTGPIRTGVIGYGLSGRVFHTPFLAADPNFVIELIATGNPDRQAQAAAHHPGATIVNTPEELLARAADLDLVVLASPPHTHLEQGLAALDAGAAVVIDKPFAPSVADAEKLIARSEQLGLPLMVFQNRRWDGDFLTVEKLLAEDRLGNIHRFESTFERWSPKLKPGWQDKISTAQGAGILFDLGSHLIDQALRLFGPVFDIHAEFSVVRHGGLTEDDAFLALTHEGGVHSHLTMSRVAAQVGPRFRVLGSDGGYMVYGLDGQEAALAGEMRPTDEGYGITPQSQWGTVGVVGDSHPLETEPGAYPEFYARVADAILNGGPVPVDPYESLEVVRIIEQAHLQSSPRS